MDIAVFTGKGNANWRNRMETVVTAAGTRAAMNDHQWFSVYSSRNSRLRAPNPGEAIDKFETLGMHDERRRCMLVVRINRHLQLALGKQFLYIPFLAFNDETIENRDDVLLPLLKELLDDAVKRELPPARPRLIRDPGT